MKKLRPDRETLLQYVYDYGTDQTSKLFGIEPKDIEAIINPTPETIGEHRFNYTTKEVSAILADVIAKNYEHLRAKYVGNTTYLELSQTDEDIFHNTLLKVISEGIEDSILDHIEYRIKMLRYQTKMDHKQLKKLFTNAVSKEATETAE